MNTSVVQIMWKEIGIGILILYVVRNIIDVYIIKTYQKLERMYYDSSDLDRIKLNAKKLLKMSEFFSVGPWNKKIYLVYNGICWLLASMSLIEENEDEFLTYCSRVKKEKEFEMKSFVLSLYYRSKNDVAQAKRYYKAYVECKHEDEDIAIIMDYILCKKDRTKTFDEALKRFRNPAIIKLFKENEFL